MSNRSNGNIQKLGNKKYLLRFSAGFDDFGKRIQLSKTVHCNNKREAEKLLMEFYKEIEALKEEKATGIPQNLQQLFNEWYKNHVAKLTENTQSFYKDLWKNHLSDKGRIKLKTIVPKNIYAILEEIEQPRTKSGVYKMLKAMFNKAVMWGYMPSNPCDRVEAPQYKAKEKSTLTQTEIERLNSVISKEERKYQAIFYFAVLCGLRRQEIIGLKWSDINFNENYFTVKRATAISKGKGTVEKATKTEKSQRKIYMHDLLKQALLLWYNEQNSLKFKMGDKWHNNDWIFTQINGELMNLHTPSNWWNKFAKANGINNVTFHGLRHTTATYMIKSNIPISTVSSVLGHANVSTTLNIYTHVIEDTKQEAINVMGDIFSSDEAKKTAVTI